MGPLAIVPPHDQSAGVPLQVGRQFRASRVSPPVVSTPVGDGAAETSLSAQSVTARWWPRFRRSAAIPALLIALVRVVGAIILERGSFLVLQNTGTSAVPHSLYRDLIRWDAAFYLRIAEHGYAVSNPQDPSFYPLYPYTVRYLEKLGPFTFEQAALAVSWVALWFACWGVIRFTAAIFPEAKAWRAGMLLAFFPVSVFLVAGYAESLFIALAAWTLVAIAERRIWVAAVLCGLASAARPEGIILGLGVVIWALLDGVQRGQHLHARSAVTLAGKIIGLGVLSISGLLLYSLYLWTRYHDVFQEFRAQKYWDRVVTWPFHPLFWSLDQVLGRHIRPPDTMNAVATFLVNDAMVIFAVIGVVVLVRLAWHRKDLWWLVIPTVLVVLVIVSNAARGKVPEGEARLVMCIVPLYAVTARLGSESGWTSLLAGSALLAALFEVIFTVGALT